MGKNVVLIGLSAWAITCFLKQYFSCEYFTANLMLQHSGSLWCPLGAESPMGPKTHLAKYLFIFLHWDAKNCLKYHQINYTKIKLRAFRNHSVMEVECSVHKISVFHMNHVRTLYQIFREIQRCLTRNIELLFYISLQFNAVFLPLPFGLWRGEDLQERTEHFRFFEGQLLEISLLTDF